MDLQKTIIFSLLLLIVALLGVICIYRQDCFATKNINAQDTEQHTLYIQGSSNIPLITSIKEVLTPVINNIIKDELHLDTAYNFDFFLPKQWQRLTLYTLNNVNPTEINLIASTIKNIFSKNKNNFLLKNVTLMPQLNFYGDQQDELVLMINDPSKELSLLNYQIKTAMHQMSKDAHTIDLYNISKSEKFPYAPHIGLGRIRSTSIKQHIKDPTQVGKIYTKLTQRIINESFPIIKELLHNNASVSFNALCIFEVPSRTCVVEYPIV